MISNASSYSKYALQTAIVLLGFNMNANYLLELSADYTLIVSAYVVATLFIGLALGKWLSQSQIESKLISTGTAICGGTAIASLSPILRASPEQTGTALGIVFILNALALITFPYIGQWLDLSQAQFGVWTALAIHDTSSVVATSVLYGEESGQIATAIKLGRTLWLVPVLLFFSFIEGSKETKVRIPAFIFLFVGSSLTASYLEIPADVIVLTSTLSKALLVLALFLVGASTTRASLQNLNKKHLYQALILWTSVVIVTLGFVHYSM